MLPFPIKVTFLCLQWLAAFLKRFLMPPASMSWLTRCPRFYSKIIWIVCMKHMCSSTTEQSSFPYRKMHRIGQSPQQFCYWFVKVYYCHLTSRKVKLHTCKLCGFPTCTTLWSPVCAGQGPSFLLRILWGHGDMISGLEIVLNAIHYL